MSAQNKRGFAFVLILIVLFVIGTAAAVGLYFVNKNPSSKTTTPISTQDTAATKTPAAIPDKTVYSDDETANWKMYTSQKYNYSVKYPSDWTIKEEQDGNKILVSDPRGGYRNEGYSNLEIYGDFAGDWMCDPDSNKLTESTIEVKPGLNATLFKCVYSDGFYPVGYTKYLLDTPNNTFVHQYSGLPNSWAFGYSQPGDNTVEKILNTFTITK